MEKIVKILQSISDFFIAFYDAVIDLCSYILSILWFIRYWWKTLLVWIFKLIVSVLDWWVFVNVARALHDLSEYIGGPAVIFIASLLFIAVIRILVAFVFKLLRLNIDYKPKWNEKTRKSDIDKIVDDFHQNID